MDPSAINQQVARILHSHGLANKGQLRRLLEVLHKNIESQNNLSPDLVIRELWPTETRTKRAADVATEINRLRHALDVYYKEEGPSDPITIVLPNRAASAVNGTHEKLWIAAKPRPAEPELAGSPEAKESDRPDEAGRTGGRRGLKIGGAIAVLCVVSLATYATIRMLALPDQPKIGQLDGSALVIMNADGKELWRKVFPEGFENGLYSRYLHTGVWFADLEGKGHTSVLFVYSSGLPTVHSSTLICYSDRGKEKWRWIPGKALPELEGDQPVFKTFALGILKATEKNPPRIVASSAHAMWWPSEITLLDSSGKVLSEYWHSGRLDYMILADLDGDGREEIVATGVNNDYLQGTLVVLDPDRVFGASAEIRPQFRIHGMAPAQERLRLLFPRSDINKTFFSYNDALVPSVNNGSIQLAVEECVGGSGGCVVAYDFDRDLHLVAAYPGEGFRSAHVQFYQNRKDNHPFSAEEQTAFQKVRCLVGCKTEFVVVGKVDPN